MRTKKKRPIRTAGLILLALMLLSALFIIGLHVYDQVMLKKEAALLCPQGQRVEVDGREMEVYTEGDGDTVLVFMAGANTPAVTLDFRPLYRQLTDTYQIVVLEKFGYGYSDDIEGERDLDTILRQDREALQKAGIKAPYVLCPHSASGLEAIRWAQQYPEEVEAIVGLDMAVPEQYDLMVGDLDDVTPQTYEAVLEEDEFYNFWMYDMGGYRLYPIASVFPASASDRLTKEERAEYRAITYHWYSQFYKTAMFREGLATARQIEALSSLREAAVPDVPTLQILSDDAAMFAAMLGEDGLDQWVQIHERYIDGLTDARIVRLACGHYVHAEAPDEISTEIRDFLDSLEG